MVDAKKRETVERALADGKGILRCDPAWVARDFLPPGFRLGLANEEDYDVGERGYICERWLCSTTKADNAVGPPDEGLSYVATEGEKATLKEAVELCPKEILGEDYAHSHGPKLGRLAKIYDFAARIPYHLHQMKKDAALVGANSKEESYYFPEDVPLGPQPETFFGVHPHIVEQGKQDILLPYLVDWDSDLILKHSFAYLLVSGEGFHLPAGGLHGPGTALTIELQEDSDVFAMLQALVNNKIIPKDLLFKDVRKEDRETLGEKVILSQVDWEISGDPYFYPNRHLSPQLIADTATEAGREYWIYYNTTRFSGKKLVVEPGQTFECVDNGVYSVLVWRGKGKFGGLDIEGENHGMDELVVTHDRAVKPIAVENTGDRPLQLIKFFGPDVNLKVPMIPKYPAG